MSPCIVCRFISTTTMLMSLIICHVSNLYLFKVFADDGEILKAVFEHHMLVNFVDSDLFRPLVDYLTEHQKEADYLEPNVIINELHQAGRTSEAVAVDKACRGQQGRCYRIIYKNNFFLKFTMGICIRAWC